MAPGSILIAPNTIPAWTRLSAHAVGLVTDIGCILAHGSIVAREYGIPAVLGVGNGTVRIRHGQSITIDDDAGSVTPHEEGTTAGLSSRSAGLQLEALKGDRTRTYCIRIICGMR